MDLFGELMIGGFVGAIAFLGLMAFLKSFITVKLPNELLVITGKKGKNGQGESIARGRAVHIPFLQQVNTLDLGILPINVRVEGVNSANGITVGADATACVCIDDDDEAMLYTAVQKVKGRPRQEIANQIQQTLVGNFRAALNKVDPLVAIGMTDYQSESDITAIMSASSNTLVIAEDSERAQFRQSLVDEINGDLKSFGMKVVSVSLQRIWDTSSYIANLAQRTLATKREFVEIEEAKLKAIADKSESDAKRRMMIAEKSADEKILIAREKFEMYRRESVAKLKEATFEADNGIEEHKNRNEKQIQTETVILNKLQNESQVILKAEAEQKASLLMFHAEKQAILIRAGAKNSILKAKSELLANNKESGKTVLFVQQQLPSLFASFAENSKNTSIESMLVMDDTDGLNKAINRGPEAFSNYVNKFEETFGINIKEMMNPKGK